MVMSEGLKFFHLLERHTQDRERRAIERQRHTVYDEVFRRLLIELSLARHQQARAVGFVGEALEFAPFAQTRIEQHELDLLSVRAFPESEQLAITRHQVDVVARDRDRFEIFLLIPDERKSLEQDSSPGVDL